MTPFSAKYSPHDAAYDLLRGLFKSASAQQLHEEAMSLVPRFVWVTLPVRGYESEIAATVHKEERKRIKTIGETARALFEAIDELHPYLTRGIEGAGIEGDLYDHLEHLNHLLKPLLGYVPTRKFPSWWGEPADGDDLSAAPEALPPLAPVLDLMQARADQTLDLNHNRIPSEFALKVHLVDCTSGVYQRLTGETAPEYSPGDPYRSLVEGAIVICGKSWNVENTLRAWREFRDRMKLKAGGQTATMEPPDGGCTREAEDLASRILNAEVLQSPRRRPKG